MVQTALGLRYSARTPPGIDPTTQFIIKEDHALNYSYAAPLINTDMMMGVTILTNVWLLLEEIPHLPSL